MKKFITFLFLLPVLTFGQINGIHLQKAVPDGRVDSVYQGINLPKSFTGEDVIIGVTDWGFDYSHPVFYDAELQNYRILRAWDQFRTGGPAPEGFNYGTEYVGQEQLLAAQCDTFNIYDYGYHGTHVASIAAGAGGGTSLRGVAPGSNILLCTFLVEEQAFIDGIRWMYNVAQQEQKRLVVNMSWGLYYMGFMDGTGPIADAMQELSDLGVVFVSSAGNNGDDKFHLHQDFNTNQDTLRSKINFATSKKPQINYGQALTMISSPNTSFKYSVMVLDNSGNILGYTPFFNTADGDFTIDTTCVVLGFPVEMKIDNVQSSVPNHRPSVQLRVKKTIYGGINFGICIVADEGDFHAWNLIELTTGVGNWGAAFMSLGDGWTAGDKEYGISAPSNVDCAITVAAHIARSKNSAGIFTGNGAMASFSSHGPVIDNFTKPDISAPGQDVVAALSSYTTESLESSHNVTFNGRTYGFTSLSGTSMASPFVAGVVALMLEANPYLSPSQIKNILRQTAFHDEYTEASNPLIVGAGKVDAYQAVLAALNTTGIDTQHSVSETRCRVYPNPVASNAYVVIEGDAWQMNAQLFDMSGKMIMEQQVYQGVNDFNLSNLPSGCYFLRINDGQTVMTKKVIKQ